MTGGGTVTSIVLMALTLDVAPLRVTIYFLGDISTVKEAF